MRLLPLITVFFLTACQVNNKPDLARLYQPIGTDYSNTPLILMHGSLGSKLRLKSTEEEVWPGKIKDLIFSNYKNLANQIKPNSLEVDYSIIESYAIFDSYSGLSMYDDIIETLVEFGGYQYTDINQAAPTGRGLYAFHYDWRQDNVHNAQRLAHFIDQVLAHQSNHQQVDVVAHSLGGLILRYYHRFGEHDVLPELMAASNTPTSQLAGYSQANKIRHAIFLGTPQLGTVKAIDRLKSGFDFNLRNIPVEVQVTMPSVYQLLPHPASHWATSPNGENLDIDIFNPELWQQNQWAIYDPIITSRIIKFAESEAEGEQKITLLQRFFNLQLQRAKAFWLALSPAYETEHEGYVVMGGSCRETLNRLIVDDDAANLLTLQKDVIKDKGDVKFQQSLLFEPGDGQVSKSSLIGQVYHPSIHQTFKTVHIKYPVFVCEDHLTLTKNITFQDNLLHVLLND